MLKGEQDEEERVTKYLKPVSETMKQLVTLKQYGVPTSLPVIIPYFQRLAAQSTLSSQNL